MYDPERYRAKEEVDAWRQRDPLTLFPRRLIDAGLLADGDVDAIEAEVAAEIHSAVAFAEAGTLEAIENLTRYVYSERPG